MPCFSNFRRRCAIFVVVFLACFEHHHGTVRAFSVPTSSPSSSSSLSSSSITKEVVQSNNNNSNNKNKNSSNNNQNTVPSTRRDFGASAVAASLVAAGSVGGAASWCLAPTPVHAAAAETTGGAASADGLIPYEDTRYKFTLMIPSSWETTPEQALPDRRKIDLWFAPNSEQKTLLFIAYTPTRGDFTSLGSFGSVEEVGQSTILPKAELATKQGIESEMLKSYSKNQAYYFDYVQEIKDGPQPKTHFRTIFALVEDTNSLSAGLTLVTITVQTPEAQYPALEPLMNKIIESYAPTK